MSFSLQVKRELCALPLEKECCIRAECYGMLLGCRTFRKDAIVFKSEQEEITRRCAALLKEGFGITCRITAPARVGGFYTLRLTASFDVLTVLNAFGYTGDEPFLRVNRGIYEDDCCVSAFLRGLFLSCGSISHPNREYHFEFSVGKYHLARDVVSVVGENLTTPKLTTRRSGWVVYIKESEQIEDILTFMQAVNSSLELMQIKVMKGLRNKINRATNCETANLTKSLEAGRRHLEAVATIEALAGLDLLSDELKQVAILRRDNPEASLSELGQMLDEPLSRSGVNHRLTKIVEIAAKLKNEKQKEQ